jgi:hypothetical protein
MINFLVFLYYSFIIVFSLASKEAIFSAWVDKLPNTPLTKRGDESEPYTLANSTASLIATFIGVILEIANSHSAMRMMSYRWKIF